MPARACAESYQQTNTQQFGLTTVRTPIFRCLWQGCRCSTRCAYLWCTGAATACLQSGSRWAGDLQCTVIPKGPGCRRSRPTSPEANAAGKGTPGKQDSHGIRRVQNDAGGFPERSTQPMVGSGIRRSTCRQRIDEAARGSNSGSKPRSAGKRFHQRYLLSSGHIPPVDDTKQAFASTIPLWQSLAKADLSETLRISGDSRRNPALSCNCRGRATPEHVGNPESGLVDPSRLTCQTAVMLAVIGDPASRFLHRAARHLLGVLPRTKEPSSDDAG